VYQYASDIKKKKEIIKEEIDSLHMKECTFQPKSARGEKVRSMQEFLEDQVKFQKKRKENLNKVAEDRNCKAEELIVPLPAIDEYSRTIADKKRADLPIYERLYAKSKKPAPAPVKDVCILHRENCLGDQENTSARGRPRHSFVQRCR
jgi:hypothetical protein